MHKRSQTVSVRAIAALFALLVPLTGCSTVEGSKPFKETKRFYYNHINTPAKLDLDDPTTLGEADGGLVRRTMYIDSQLTSLERALNSMGSGVDQRTVDMFMRRFPWLSNLVLVDAGAKIIASTPEVPLKELDFTPLLEPAPKAALRDLRFHVQETPLGPEIMMARPFYEGQDLKRMMIATFDMRSLMPYAADSEHLSVRTREHVLWEGDKSGNAVNAVDWAGQLRNRSYGKDNGAVWLVRYLGYLPLIFAAPAS